ncbi:MAG: molybdopterin biosynthesis enzyme MoaB, partial [Myxococcota bacterium]
MSGTVAVLAVSDDAGVADRVGRVLGNAGFKVVGPRDIDASQVVEAVKAANASAVVVVGDGDLPGLSAARLAATFTRSIPGWAPVVYAAAFQALGPRAVQHRTVAGFVDGCPIVALPAEAAFAMVAVEQVLVAELGRWIQAGMELVMAGDEAIEPSPSVPDALVLVGDTDTDSDDDPPALSPSGRLGALGRRGNSFSITATPDEAAPPPEEEAEDGPPAGGWKRAVWDLGGEIRFDEREELPQPVEKLAPLHDVLLTAGETAVLVLPNKLRY